MAISLCHVYLISYRVMHWIVNAGLLLSYFDNNITSINHHTNNNPNINLSFFNP